MASSAHVCAVLMISVMLMCDFASSARLMSRDGYAPQAESFNPRVLADSTLSSSASLDASSTVRSTSDGGHGYSPAGDGLPSAPKSAFTMTSKTGYSVMTGYFGSLESWHGVDESSASATVDEGHGLAVDELRPALITTLSTSGSLKGDDTTMDHVTSSGGVRPLDDCPPPPTGDFGYGPPGFFPPV